MAKKAKAKAKSKAKPKGSYEKDLAALQKFLLGRSPCMVINSADTRRVERLLEQISLAHERPLYKTIKGKGVYSYKPGEEAYLVVQGINEPFLDALINQLRPVELHSKQLQAVDEYFAQMTQKMTPKGTWVNQGQNWLNTAMGHFSPDAEGALTPPDQHINGPNGTNTKESFHGNKKGIPNFPVPDHRVMLSAIQRAKLFVPIEVHPKDLPHLKFETKQIIDEFLVRFGLKVQSSAGDFQARKNPMLLSPAAAAASGDTPGAEVVDSDYEYAQDWFTVHEQVGIHYGVEDPQGATPLSDCLDMISRAQPDASIIFLMEGFKYDLPDAEGRFNQSMGDSMRDLEAATRALEKGVNQIAIMSPGVNWTGTNLQPLITQLSAGGGKSGSALNKPDLKDVTSLLRQMLAGLFYHKETLYNKVLEATIARGKEGFHASGKGNLPLDVPERVVYFDFGLRAAAAALRGLTETKMIELIWDSIRSTEDLDPDLMDGERRRIIERVAGLKLVEPNVSFKDVGGLETLKAYVENQGDNLFVNAEQAQDPKRGLGGHTAKGILLIGLPGTGKSLIAKAIAKELDERIPDEPVTLIRLDTGALRGKFVGESEQRTREALATVEAFAPVVLWMDEIEKAFSSGGGESTSDIGTRMMGYFLTWMQERTAPVFLVATANDVSALPPEFKREGRWDAKFYTPLPNKDACVDILKYNLKKFQMSLYEEYDEFTGKTLPGAVDNLSNRTKLSKKDRDWALEIWSRWAHSRNEEDKRSNVWEVETPTVVGSPNEQTQLQKVPKLKVDGTQEKRYLGYNGAEIETSVKMAVQAAKNRHTL
jgi:SpoVK/Ycf46/Vps4 family AAA+-type ATPase